MRKASEKYRPSILIDTRFCRSTRSPHVSNSLGTVAYLGHGEMPTRIRGVLAGAQSFDPLLLAEEHAVAPMSAGRTGRISFLQLSFGGSLVVSQKL